jgi:hypothetical protein
MNRMVGDWSRSISWYDGKIAASKMCSRPSHTLSRTSVARPCLCTHEFALSCNESKQQLILEIPV